jgi:hypothetical protein
MKKLIGIIMSSLLLSGCLSNPSYVARYGIAFNADREKREIPIIPTTWTVQDMGDFFDCFDPNPDLKLPHRLSKRVCIDRNGKIAKEVDHFYSGKSFAFDQTTLSQEIEITYDYSKENSGKPWQAIVSLGSNQVSEAISIEKADRILATWGLTRTNVVP